MLDKVGEEFDGIISSVTSFGMFVELDNTVEGLIRLSELNDDYYHFHEQHMVLIGERTANVFRIGDEVRIRVARVNMDEHTIDFELIESKSRHNGRDFGFEIRKKRGRGGYSAEGRGGAGRGDWKGRKDGKGGRPGERDRGGQSQNVRGADRGARGGRSDRFGGRENRPTDRGHRADRHAGQGARADGRVDRHAGQVVRGDGRADRRNVTGVDPAEQQAYEQFGASSGQHVRGGYGRDQHHHEERLERDDRYERQTHGDAVKHEADAFAGDWYNQGEFREQQRGRHGRKGRREEQGRGFNPYDKSSGSSQPRGKGGINFGAGPGNAERSTPAKKEYDDSNWVDRLIADAEEEVDRPRFFDFGSGRGGYGRANGSDQGGSKQGRDGGFRRNHSSTGGGKKGRRSTSESGIFIGEEAANARSQGESAQRAAKKKGKTNNKTAKFVRKKR